MSLPRKTRLKNRQKRLASQGEGTFHNGPSYAVADAKDLERRFMATLQKSKLALSSRRTMTPENAEVLLILQRIGTEVAEFSLWLEDSKETEWLREAS